MRQAFAQFEVKAVNAEDRILEGWATTDSTDRMDDTVEPKGAVFSLPLPLLHQHEHEKPIGHVLSAELRTQNGVTGFWIKAQIAKDTGLEYVEKAWLQIRSGLVRWFSIGFRTLACKPKDKGFGLTFTSWEWLELSAVTIPANADCTIETIRAFAPKPVPEVSSDPSPHGDRPTSPASDHPAVVTTTRSMKMSLADKIAAKQAEILKFQDHLASLTADVEDMTDEQAAEIAQYTKKLDSARGHLKAFQEAEQALAGHAFAKTADPTATNDPTPRATVKSLRKPGDLASKTLAAIVKAAGTRTSALEVAREHVSPDLRNEMEVLVRSATAPAITTDSTWATNLVREEWGQFFALLRDQSVYPQVPGARIDLTLTTNFPIQNGRGALAGGFVAENGAIPVKVGSIGTTSLAPKKLAIISAFSRELARRSIPAIQSVIERQIVEDTAEVLDTTFLGSGARSTTQPAGLRDTTETVSANINAITNTGSGTGTATVAEIVTDIKALLGRVWAIKESTGAWLMNPAQKIGLANKQDAASGQFPFRDEVNAGRFFGLPIFTSTNVTAGVVAFVGSNSMVFGSEFAPLFEMDGSATLHFETSPSAISAVATPNTVAAPAINLFQQDLFAIKMTMGLDWRIVRAGGVQILTGAGGW